jgi:hypothetical protein
MDIKEVLTRKSELASSIKEWVVAFEKETTTYVESIDIKRLEGLNNIVVAVNIKVKI